MRIAAKTEYACKALLELAGHWPQTTPVQMGEIARKRQIPLKFLTQILIHLKQLGYVESVRGKQGGYILAKPPQEIRLSDVLRGFVELPATAQPKTKSENANVLTAIWQEADLKLLNFFDQISLAELNKREKNLETIPMYTI